MAIQRHPSRRCICPRTGPRIGDDRMNRILEAFLAGTIKKGCLDIVDASGALCRFGDGSGVPVGVRFNSAAAERAVLLNPR